MLFLFSTQPVDRNQDEDAALLLEVHACRMRGIVPKLQCRRFLRDSRSIFCQWGWSGPGTGFPKRQWNLHCWRFSERSRNRPTLTPFKWACFECKVGLEQLGEITPLYPQHYPMNLCNMLKGRFFLHFTFPVKTVEAQFGLFCYVSFLGGFLRGFVGFFSGLVWLLFLLVGFFVGFWFFFLVG